MKRRSRDLRLLRTLILILVLFMVSALPMGVLFIVSYTEMSKDLLKATKYIITMSLLNSLVNPWVYFWRFPEMRAAVRCQYMRCCRKYRQQRHLSVVVKQQQQQHHRDTSYFPNNRKMSQSRLPRGGATEKPVTCCRPEQSGTKESYSSSIGL